MPYSKDLEARIQKIVSSWKNTDSKKMFGGICHLLDGNMF
jgi:TfoX/Sxy family transcriptional regulator of competence genes